MSCESWLPVLPATHIGAPTDADGDERAALHDRAEEALMRAADVPELREGARPAVGEDQRQRPWPLPALVNGVYRDPIEIDADLIEAVERCSSPRQSSPGASTRSASSDAPGRGPSRHSAPWT
jgi:hypothetical protein